MNVAAVTGLVSDVEVARRVLGAEAAGLRSLAASLDDTFGRAVDALAACTGRVVVSGMGKSGHVGRKIAATFASTGTPAAAASSTTFGSPSVCDGRASTSAHGNSRSRSRRNSRSRKPGSRNSRRGA